MEASGTRRSERIAQEIPIEVFGFDNLGKNFVERTHTLLVASHGARIILSRKLNPEQEIVIRSLATGEEAEAQVMGLIEEGKEGFHYGVKILDSAPNFWEIEFPPLKAVGESVGRIVLQCTRCKTREVAYLDEFELEILEATDELVRPCRRCADSSLWKKSLTDFVEPQSAASAPEPHLAKPESAAPVPKKATAPAEARERRREPRLGMHVKACVRSANAHEEIVSTKDVSRHGLRFVSFGKYSADDEIQVAVPYSPRGGNIFLAARIVNVHFLPSEGLQMYGVAFR
jgi:hypothetical protein